MKALQIEQISNIIGYKFNNDDLLVEALTHPSLSALNHNKNILKQGNYERLEFLGDAVLGLIITEFLINEYGNEREGALAKRRSALICGEALSEIATQIGLGNFLMMTEGEKNGGGQKNKTNLENALEALIGAIYIDSGFEKARQFVYKYWLPMARSVKTPPKDPKTSLQEWAQKQGKSIPIYNIIDTKGPAHLPTFVVEVKVDGLEGVSASASSKRLAERYAAELLLQKIAYLKLDK
ncbi:Ribonuclease 3 [Rickettsiales bacterium Ac37b]|nr:Ribonuclease 3 [Rickettsiales bacterium Ac37b]